MGTRKEFLEELKKRGATKAQALKAMDLKRSKGVPFDDEIKLVKPSRSSRTPQSTRQAEPATERGLRRKQQWKQKPMAERVARGAAESILGPVRGAGMILRKPFMSDEDYQARKEKLGQMGEYYQESTEGDIPSFVGEMGGEMGALAIPATKLAKLGKTAQLGKTGQNILTGGRIGGLSAGMHQAGNLGSGRGFNPLAAIGETVVSGAIPGAGSKVGKFLQKEAPEMLRTAVKPARKFMNSTNPPKFNIPLDKKLVTKLGGLEAAEERTSDLVAKLGGQYDDLVKSSGIEINITNANRKVAKKLNDMVKNAEIDLDDAEGAFKHSQKAVQGAKKMVRGKLDKTKKGKRWDNYKNESDDIYNKSLDEQQSIQAYEEWNEVLNSFGPEKSTVQKMANYVRNSGDKVNKDGGMLVREHIPASKFGQSSDELASNFGMDEGQFMEMLAGMTKKPKKNVVDELGDFFLSGSKPKPVKGKVKVSGEEAVKIRRLADKNSKFDPFKGPTQNPNKVVFNEAYRRVLEDEIEGNLTGASLAQYQSIKKQMADVIPFRNAVRFRLGQQGNNYKLSLMDLGAMGVGGALGGVSVPAKIATAGAIGALRRLTSTPGGAAALYNTGKRLQNPTKTKDLIMQAGRYSADNSLGGNR